MMKTILLPIFRRYRWLYLCGLLGLSYGIYICYHLFYGSNNLIEVRRLLQQADQLQHQAETLKQKRETLESEVKMLRPNNINKDLLEEKARQLLKMADEEDVIIIFKDE